jgi:hypothetical protein
MSILRIFRDELREIAWLASIVGGFSVLGVGLAVTLALRFEGCIGSSKGRKNAGKTHPDNHLGLDRRYFIGLRDGIVSACAA